MVDTSLQEETADGRSVTTTAKLDGDTLTKTQVAIIMRNLKVVILYEVVPTF